MASSSSYEKTMREHEAKATKLAAKHIERLPLMLDKIDKVLLKWPFIQQTKDRFGVRPSYIIPIVISSLMMFFGWFDDVISNAVGFFYPAWQSFKAIESKGGEDDKQWLTYWVVFAAFSLVETASSILLFWVPFYYILKIAFLLWLLLPQFQGATFVYNKAVRPFLLHHEGKIDGMMDRLNGQTERFRQMVADTTTSTVAGIATSGVRRRANGQATPGVDEAD